MEIKDCKNIEEYIKMLNCSSIDDLTDDQVIAWADENVNDFKYAKNAINILYADNKRAQERIMSLLRMAISSNKEFHLPFLPAPLECTPVYRCCVGNDVYSLDEYVYSNIE